MHKFREKGYVSGLDGLDSSADRNFQIACMKIDWPDSINHLQQSALTSPGLDFWSPSSPSYPALLKAPRGRFKITSLPGAALEYALSRIGLGEDTAALEDIVGPDELIASETLRRRKFLLDRLRLHGIPVDAPTDIFPPPTVVCPGDGSAERPYQVEWAVPSP